MRNKLFKFILNCLIATSLTASMSIYAEDLDVEIIDSYSGSVQYVGVSGDIGTPNEQWEAELNSYAPHPIAWRLTVYTLNDMDTLETLSDMSEEEREASLKSSSIRSKFKGIGRPIYLIDEGVYHSTKISFGNDTTVYNLSDVDVVFGSKTVPHTGWTQYYLGDTATSNPNFLYRNGNAPVINGGVVYSSDPSSNFAQQRINMLPGSSYYSAYQNMINGVTVQAGNVVVDNNISEYVRTLSADQTFITAIKKVMEQYSFVTDFDAVLLYYEPMINIIEYLDHTVPDDPNMLSMVVAPSDCMYLTTYNNGGANMPMNFIHEQIKSFMSCLNSDGAIASKPSTSAIWIHNIDSSYQQTVRDMFEYGKGAVADLVLTKTIERKDTMWETPPAVRLYNVEDGNISSASYQTSVTIPDSTWNQVVEVLEYAKGIRKEKPNNFLMTKIPDDYFEKFFENNTNLKALNKDGTYNPKYLDAYDKLMQRIYEILKDTNLNLDGTNSYTISAEYPTATLKFSVNGHDYYEYSGVGSIGKSTVNCSLYTTTYSANVSNIFSTADCRTISNRQFSYADLLRNPYKYAAVRGTVTSSTGVIARPVVRMYDENALSAGSDILTVPDDLYNKVNEVILYATNADGASRPSNLAGVDHGVKFNYNVGNSGYTRQVDIWEMMDLLHNDAQYMNYYNFNKSSWEGAGNDLDSVLSNIFNFTVSAEEINTALEDVQRINAGHSEPDTEPDNTYGTYFCETDRYNYDYGYFSRYGVGNVPMITICLDANLSSTHTHMDDNPACERSWYAWNYIMDAKDYQREHPLGYDQWDYHKYITDGSRYQSSFRTSVYMDTVKGYRENFKNLIEGLWSNLDTVTVITNTHGYDSSADLRFSSEPGALSYNKDNFSYWLHGKSIIYNNTFCDNLYKGTNEKSATDTNLSSVVSDGMRVYAYNSVGNVLSASDLKNKITHSSTNVMTSKVTLGDLFRNPYSYGISYNTLATATTSEITTRPWVWSQKVEVEIPSIETFTDDPTNTVFPAPIVNTNTIPEGVEPTGNSIIATPWVIESKILKGDPALKVEISRTAKKTISDLWTPDSVKDKLLSQTSSTSDYGVYRNNFISSPFGYNADVMVNKLNETIQFVTARDLNSADDSLTYDPVKENISIMAKDQHNNVFRVADTALSISKIPNIGGVDLNRVRQYSSESSKWTVDVGTKFVKELANINWKFRGAIPMTFNYTEVIPPGMPSAIIPIYLANAGRPWTSLNSLLTTNNVWVYSQRENKVETQTGLYARYSGTATISGSWSTDKKDLDTTVATGAPVMAAGQMIPITVYDKNPSDTENSNIGKLYIELYSIVTTDEYVNEFSADSGILKYSDFSNLVNTLKSSVSTKATLHLASTLAGGVTDSSKSILTTDASVAPAIVATKPATPTISFDVATRHCEGRFGCQTFSSSDANISGTSILSDTEAMYVQLQDKLFNGLGRNSWAAEDFEGFYVAKATITISFNSPQYELAIDMNESDSVTNVNQTYLDNKSNIDNAWKSIFGSSVYNKTELHAIMPYIDLTNCTETITFNGTSTTVSGLLGNYVCGAITNINIRGSIHDKSFATY